MNPPEYRVVSIGTLAAHPLWDERTAVRTGHATTVLITAGDQRILVNPALPPTILAARLSEIAPLDPGEITDVFLTSFAPDHRRGLGLFDDARWLMTEAERGAAATATEAQLEEVEGIGDADLVRACEGDLRLLERIRTAPDALADKVDLFPLPGVTAGTCGVLLALPGLTVLICGDAVATAEHLVQGKVLPHCADVELAQDSFREAVEIADVMIPGRGNVMLNPLRRLMS